MLVGNLQSPELFLGLIISCSALLNQDDSSTLSAPSEDCCSGAVPVVFHKNRLAASSALPASALKELCVIPAQIAGDSSSGRPPSRTQQFLT